LAVEVATHLKPSQKLLATDAELDQVAKTNIKLNSFVNASAQCINFIDDYEQLKNVGPFDCIYCRWVICHIAVELQQQVLAKLLQLLKPGGYFVMDDCDNRVVEWRFKSGVRANAASQQLIEKIQPMFVDFYSVIAKDRHLNLQRDAKGMQQFLEDAADANHIEGEVSLLGEYQVILQSEQDKAAVTQGKISTQQVYEKLSGQSAQAIIEAHLQAQQDNHLVCAFLGEAVVAFKQSS
jgi:SAM-dependent methyltransferase